MSSQLHVVCFYQTLCTSYWSSSVINRLYILKCSTQYHQQVAVRSLKTNINDLNVNLSAVHRKVAKLLI